MSVTCEKLFRFGKFQVNFHVLTSLRLELKSYSSDKYDLNQLFGESRML